MTGDRTFWTEVEAIFEAIVDLDDTSRATALDARCGNRPNLRGEIELLLAADAHAESFIEPAVATVGGALAHRPPGVGSVIGPFRLAEAIGAGGMGTVYRAERADGGFAQEVAVKIIGIPSAMPRRPVASVPSVRFWPRSAIRTSSV